MISVIFFAKPPLEWKSELEHEGLIFGTKETVSAAYFAVATQQKHGALMFRIQKDALTPPIFTCITLKNLQQMIAIAEQLEAGETLESIELPEDSYKQKRGGLQ